MHPIRRPHLHLLDELATLALDLFDALCQGPILAALLLLLALLAIQVLGAVPR